MIRHPLRKRWAVQAVTPGGNVLGERLFWSRSRASHHRGAAEVDRLLLCVNAFQFILKEVK